MTCCQTLDNLLSHPFDAASLLDHLYLHLPLRCVIPSIFHFNLNTTTVCLGLSKSVLTGSHSIGCVILTRALRLSVNLFILTNVLFLADGCHLIFIFYFYMRVCVFLWNVVHT